MVGFGLDLNFTLLYLARRFVAPTALYVCADASGRLPFRDGAFEASLCADTFKYLADRSTEKGIMEGLEAEDPDLVEQIRRLMFVFEDILLVNDKGIQSVLKEIDNEVLSLALKTAKEYVECTVAH